MEKKQGRAVKESPEAHFIKYGKKLPNLDQARAKKLGARFLSAQWAKNHGQLSRTGEKNPLLPLPTYKQRLYGGKLPKAERELKDQQLSFMLEKFAKHVPEAEKAELKSQIDKYFPSRILGINSILRGFTRGQNIDSMREEGIALYHQMRRDGRVWAGLMQETPHGKTYLSKGFHTVPRLYSTPLHEGIHLMQKLGVIRYDVPFASAADRLYALELGLVTPRKSMVASSKSRVFTRLPGVLDNIKRPQNTIAYKEPRWSYRNGRKLGDWIYTKLPPESRWDYLYRRMMGDTHDEACLAAGNTLEERHNGSDAFRTS